jgi:hypothetical protein|tara:strand:+ start:534 stop:1115 length:582 start_codon:yes stop_codon:yes gene_type:complete
MANRIPLIVNASASQIQEVPSGDVVNFDNKVVLTNSTASSSASVGAVVVTGGVGIGGVLNIGNNATSSNKTSGALVVTGGVGIGGALNVGGDITAFASSDETLKENLVAIPNAVSKVGIITGYTFSWKADTGYDYLDSKTDTGVIAQQVEALGLPGITTTRDDGTKAVRYDRLVPLLIEAIKELDGRIKTLEG